MMLSSSDEEVIGPRGGGKGLRRGRWGQYNGRRTGDAPRGRRSDGRGHLCDGLVSSYMITLHFTLTHISPHHLTHSTHTIMCTPLPTPHNILYTFVCIATLVRLSWFVKVIRVSPNV